ncbi:MAG: hypothetical protein WDZ49_09455 [Litorilinea sp.]
MLIESEPLHIEAALQAQEGAQEHTSATDRAIGLAIRIGPFSAVWAVLAIGSVWAVGAAWWAGFLLFAALTFVSYAWLDGQDWRHSRAGVERFKIDRAYQLKRIEMESQAEARRMAMDTYRQLLLGDGDHEQ